MAVTTVFSATTQIRVRAAFGADLSAAAATWTWTDITADVRQAGGQTISITVGRPDDTSQTPAAACTFELDNTSGNYSAYNPLGVYWPNVKRNTPITVEMSIDSGAHWNTRFLGYASGWVPSWDPSAKLAVVSVSAAGVTQRLDRRSAPLKSALVRSVLTADASVPATVIAFWPLEDGTDSTQAASGIPGGAPLIVQQGVMSFSTDVHPVGGAGSAKPALDALNQMSGPVTGGSTTAWQVSCWIRNVFQDDPAGWCPLEVVTSTGRVVQLLLDRAGGVWNPAVDIIDHPGDTDAAHFLDIENLPIDDDWHLLQAVFVQSGPDVNVGFAVDGTDSTVTATWASETIGAPVLVRSIGAPQAGVITTGMSEIEIAGIAVHNGSTLLTDLWQAGLGWVGETPRDRVDRLCREEGITVDHSGAY